jgi:hypothetical protein
VAAAKNVPATIAIKTGAPRVMVRPSNLGILVEWRKPPMKTRRNRAVALIRG